MTTVWTAEQINRFTLQAEEIFCNEYRILSERTAIDIIQSTALYTLPSNCLDIRRITYRGIRVIPFSHRSHRTVFDGFTSEGVPRWYIYNNLGAATIKLFPTPSETIVASQANLFDPTAIAGQCIVEYYVIPDGIGTRIPEYARRRLLKAFVLQQCFLAEGKGQNLKAAAYWSKKWLALKEEYGDQLYELITSARKILNPGIDVERWQPPMAQLPVSLQGIGVDPGE